ncbi:hypothetical protein BYT27DRAFT_7185704 [Phlegmacium glaucopus]|nr:hypothetical protein BYT27DRAFT_7185704 [Phlegmacium glaucopus]
MVRSQPELMSSALDGFFMSIVTAPGPESKSFEEIRIDDYIKAYQSTGQPPQPCPEEPADDSQRASINLPPLFKPQPIRSLTLAPTTSLLPFGTSNSGRMDNSTDLQLDSAGIDNPAELPPGQEFRLPSTNGEKYHCISCMPEYTNFSLEELRYYAYLVGNTRPPASIVMDPFVQLDQEATATTPPTNSEDQFQSICGQSQYDKHSHEELRVAFLHFGREMTSAELLQLQNPSVPLPNQPIVTVPGRSIRPPVFATPTSIPIPKFTFGLR